VRAIVYERRAGEPMVALRQCPDPAPAPGEALIAVTACGICGSDRQLVRGGTAPAGMPTTAILGHEIAGRILAFGPSAADSRGAGDWRVGDDVVIHPFVACGACRACRAGAEHVCAQQQVIGYQRAGGYAQYVSVPVSTLVARPAGVSADAAATAVDAGATPYRALLRAGVQAGDAVVVIGSGGLGTACVMLARALGARVVGVSSRAVGAAALARHGAEQAWSLAEIDSRALARMVRRWSGGGCDTVVDATASAVTVVWAMDVVRPGGQVAVVGMSDERVTLTGMERMVRRGVGLFGSFGSRREDVVAVLDLAASGLCDFEELVGGRVALEQVPAILQGLGAPDTRPAAGRLVMHPSASA
jgi:D-arabinose 1-dehydrogenase-like Zn-dependent alcohol dehydrogenase